MITPALISYIQESLKSGKKKDQIKSELMMAGGWQESEVDAAFATLQTGPYKKSFGSKVASFFLTIVIVIVILGALVFAAQKFLGPTVSQMWQNIVGALPLKQNSQPAPAPVPQPIVPVTTAPVSQPAVQTPAVAAPIIPTPVTCAANDSSCLLQAASSCSPTSTTITTKVTTPGKETSIRSYTIVGPQQNQCVMKFTVKSDTNSKFAYKSASCSLSTTELSTLLGNWTTGDFYTDTGIDLYGKCSGTYFNN
jgi:hypothetical protein